MSLGEDFVTNAKIILEVSMKEAKASRVTKNRQQNFNFNIDITPLAILVFFMIMLTILEEDNSQALEIFPIS